MSRWDDADAHLADFLSSLTSKEEVKAALTDLDELVNVIPPLGEYTSSFRDRLNGALV